MSVVVDNYNTESYTLVLNSFDKVSGTNNNATFDIDWTFLPREFDMYKIIYTFQTVGGYYADGALTAVTTTPQAICATSSSYTIPLTAATTLGVGQTVTIASVLNATITGISGTGGNTVITLSNPPTTNVAQAASITVSTPATQASNVYLFTGAYSITMSATTGLAVGQTITGTNVNSTIVGLSSATVTLAQPTTGNINYGASFTVTAPSTTNTAAAASSATTITLASLTGIATGMTISSTTTGIPANTTISSINTGTLTVTLSAALTAAMPIGTVYNFTYAPTALALAVGSTTINVTGTTGIVAGLSISGTGIPASTTISAVNGNTLTLSNATAAGFVAGVALTFATFTATTQSFRTGDTSFFVSNATGIYAGMAVTGTGIASNSIVASVNGSYVTLSAGTSGTLTGSTSLSFANTINYSAARIAANFNTRSFTYDSSNKSPSLVLGIIQRDIQTSTSKSNTLSAFYCQNPPRMISRPNQNNLNIQIFNNTTFAGGITSYSKVDVYAGIPYGTVGTNSIIPTNRNYLTDTNSGGTAFAPTNDMTAWSMQIEFVPIK